MDTGRLKIWILAGTMDAGWLGGRNYVYWVAGMLNLWMLGCWEAKTMDPWRLK
jgi:hypothetical protein